MDEITEYLNKELAINSNGISIINYLVKQQKVNPDNFLSFLTGIAKENNTQITTPNIISLLQYKEKKFLNKEE